MTDLLCPLARTFAAKEATPHCRRDACALWRWEKVTTAHPLWKMAWDLSPLPDLLARLEAVPTDQRVGPVIKRDGKPFEIRHYRDLFRRYATAAGVSTDVKLMDTRAGAINDGMINGADGLELQHAANHKSFSTTERYIRAREVSANNVIKLRAGTKP